MGTNTIDNNVNIKTVVSNIYSWDPDDVYSKSALYNLTTSTVFSQTGNGSHLIDTDLRVGGPLGHLRWRVGYVSN